MDGCVIEEFTFHSQADFQGLQGDLKQTNWKWINKHTVFGLCLQEIKNCFAIYQ